MNDPLNHRFKLPPEQQAIRDKCFHPSGTFVEFPIEDVETSIPARFEKIVRMYPDRIAVEMDDERVTYEALNRAANRLANIIVANSNDSNTSVAVILPRGVSQSVAIFAVLKAGKIILLQDPKTRADVLAHFLADSQAKLIITNKDYELGFRDGKIKGVRLIHVDGSNSGVSDMNPRGYITPDMGAYIKYTSGSTGRTKGAVIPHRSVLHGVMMDTNSLHFCSHDRLVQVSGNYISRPFFTNLLNGATLCPLDLQNVGLHEFAHWLINHEITIYRAFPGGFRSFVGSLAGRERFPTLRLIRLAGEPLYRSDFELFKKYFSPDCLLNNFYASTETGVICSYYLDQNSNITGRRVPVGYPIKGKEVSIVDDEGNDLPENQPGEIVVKSRFLSLGYWQRGEDTRNNFQLSVANPETKIYHTGDIGQFSTDGCLTHLGRKDDRVKIRNFRVDIGEVEAKLAEHPEVKLTSVTAKEDFSGDIRLIAYFVPRNKPGPTVTGLRKFLGAKLPAYMVPSAFVELAELPLTGTGKVNRRALPDPGRSRPNLATPLVEPTTEVEDKLAAIWMEVLSLDQVGIHDNFFDLGGHSLAASRVISRAIQTFKLDLPVKALFDAPTVSEMAAIITQNQAKQASELQQKQTERTRGVTIPRRSTQAVVPLSFAQQRLWFLSQLEPESCTYNEISALRLDGESNINALHGALNAIVERHEVLRTTYALADDGAPVQIVNAVRAVDLPLLDISEVTGTQQDAEVQRLASELKTRPFDLSNDLPLRLALIRLSPISHVLVAVKHHIASDGWSNGVFSRELANLYQRITQGETEPLPELPIQYADYSVWQREWLQGDALARQLSYWKDQLQNVPTLELPKDRPRAASRRNQAGRRSVILSSVLTDQLKALSHQEGATLFMTLLAAFQILLQRYTGQDDIAVGSPIAGRTRSELEGLIGFFVNTLVYRNNLSGDPSFREFLASVRVGALTAYEHQDLPFEKLVEELNPERSLSHSPLFQVLFAVQNVPRQKLEIPGLTATSFEIESTTAKFDLFAAFIERDRQLVLRLEYNADLFNADTVERMVGHFRTLLEGIVANPDQPIGELNLLTETERHQLLIEWNDTRRDIAQPGNVVAMFERQVELSPDAIAVVFESSRLTYQELNQRANQLAHYLIRHGVQAETHVAVCLERSLELAISFLAILKAGGVYAPLDPSYPRERLSLMVQDMQAPLIVTVQSLESQFSSGAERLIVLETDQENIAREDHSNPRLAIASHCPAYLLYTSGSTGKPKGVVMGHGALENLISWQVENFSEPLSARTLQFAPLGFDVSIQEMLATWCSGGILIFINDDLRRDGFRLLRFLDEHSVERIFLPFVALQHLADAAAYGNCFPQSLREIITAGEQLQLTESLRLFLNRLGDCCLRNQYGPTESHVVTEFTIQPPFERWPDLPPIGRPIANTQIYILDQYLAPVPISVAGEIYIGGEGVARGYLNQPELTTEKFIYHSFNGEPARRLYKTGDMARYLPDSNIEFLGRIDTQVKIRGYRIELGEIEVVLGQHPAVREAVVLAREDSRGDPTASPRTDMRLVAYVVAPSDTSTKELRSFLKQKLPEFMVPSAFVMLESLPLTPNGKVDRLALSEPASSRPELDETFLVPRTSTEELLANIWAEILKLEKVGIHDNFFDLGGHSLLATRIVSRIREEFRIDLPLRALFEKPTVASLSDHIVSIRWARDENKPTSKEGVDQTEEIIL